MPNEPKWGDSLSSISKAIFIKRVNGVSDKIHVGIITLITDDGITTYDYELEYVTIMSHVPSLIDRLKEVRNINKVWVERSTRKLFMGYLRKEENNA